MRPYLSHNPPFSFPLLVVDILWGEKVVDGVRGHYVLTALKDMGWTLSHATVDRKKMSDRKYTRCKLINVKRKYHTRSASARKFTRYWFDQRSEMFRIKWAQLLSLTTPKRSWLIFFTSSVSSFLPDFQNDKIEQPLSSYISLSMFPV